jgi:ribosomal protein S27AE
MPLGASKLAQRACPKCGRPVVLSRKATWIKCSAWVWCGWSQAITPDPPILVSLPVRDHLERVLALLTGDVVDGHWVGKQTGTPFMVIRQENVERARAHLHAALNPVGEGA